MNRKRLVLLGMYNRTLPTLLRCSRWEATWSAATPTSTTSSNDGQIWALSPFWYNAWVSYYWRTLGATQVNANYDQATRWSIVSLLPSVSYTQWQWIQTTIACQTPCCVCLNIREITICIILWTVRSAYAWTKWLAETFISAIWFRIVKILYCSV